MHAMSYDFDLNTYNPNNLVLFGGNYKSPGMEAWSPALEKSNVVFANTLQGDPGLANKFRDFNSK